MTAFTMDFTDDCPADRQECDFCGDWHTELRLIDHQGWTVDSVTCRDCFGDLDEPSFDDLELVQEAIRYA